MPCKFPDHRTRMQANDRAQRLCGVNAKSAQPEPWRTDATTGAIAPRGPLQAIAEGENLTPAECMAILEGWMAAVRFAELCAADGKSASEEWERLEGRPTAKPEIADSSAGKAGTPAEPDGDLNKK